MRDTVNIEDIESIGFDRITVDTRMIHDRLKELKKNYRNARQPLETLWDSYYASYMTTPAAVQRVSATAKRHVGDVNTAWRHKLKTPKAFETVETVVSWMMSAYFPNEYWFDLKPVSPMYDPNYQQQLDILKYFLRNSLDKADLKRKFRMFLRELAIAGTAAIAFPLVGTTLKLDVLPCYSFYLDPESQDPNEANMIRYYSVSTIQLMKLLKQEYFNVAEENDIVPDRGNGYNVDIHSLASQNIDAFMGITPRVAGETKYYHNVFEYWGNLIVNDGMLINVRATFTDEVLLGIERNPFEKRPFVIGNYVSMARSPYGIGALQPIASQLYYKDVLTSRHADNVAVGADVMLEVVEGNVLQPDKLTVRPGQRIMVTKPGSVNPVVMPMNNTSLTEMGLIDQVIDKATGTGPYIGVNAGRSGDRVTAAEISAQREAGGNRLTDVFSDIEVTVLLPLLMGYYYYLQKFATALEAIVRTPDDSYYILNGQAFSTDLEFTILGAANVADKEYRTRQFTGFLELAAGNEQMAQRINWDEAVKVLAQMYIPDMAQRVIQAAPPPAPPEGMMAPDPMAVSMQEAAQFSGGGPGQQALQATEQSMGLPAAGERLRQRLTNPQPRY